jgi:hypothetical protein
MRLTPANINPIRSYPAPNVKFHGFLVRVILRLRLAAPPPSKPKLSHPVGWPPSNESKMLACFNYSYTRSFPLTSPALPLHPIISLPKSQSASSRDTPYSPSPVSSGGFQGTTSMLGGSFSPRSCSQALIFFSLSSHALQTPPPKTRVWRRQPSAWITSPVMVTDPVDSVEEVEEVEWVFV